MIIIIAELLIIACDLVVMLVIWWINQPKRE